MTEVQTTYWRELPSLVVARAGDEVVKTPLVGRFQEAIDEAAMRLGETGSAAYLEGWRRTDWIPAEGDPAEAADREVAELEERWDQAALSAYLDRIGPASS